MSELGLLSLLPPLLAIVLALLTRRVVMSLFLGVLSGYVILAGGNPLTGGVDAIKALIAVFSSAGNTRIIVFTILVGVLIALTQRSGGVAGFVDWLFARLNKAQAHVESGKTGSRRHKIIVQLLALATGIGLFIESNISILTVGTVYRPVFDRLGISREKLAYITDSSAAPSCILIPFNAWGAYIATLLLAQNIEQPFSVVLQSIAFNFYPMITLLILVIVIMSGRDIGEMKRAQIRVDNNEGLLRAGARPMMAADATTTEPLDVTPRRAKNMLIPIGVMVIAMPVLLALTGWSESDGTIIQALQNGSGDRAVLWSVIFGLLAACALIGTQQLMNLNEFGATCVHAAKGMIPLAALMMLAFALGTLCKALGTGLYVSSLTQPYLSPALLPALVFLTAAVVAFSTGTSWGTFAIMIAIAVPLSQSLEGHLALTLAAALGGGVFGDHCSPTSDTSIITSMATANDHIDHIRTQMPYALIGGALATLAYLVLGAIYA